MVYYETHTPRRRFLKLFKLHFIQNNIPYKGFLVFNFTNISVIEAYKGSKYWLDPRTVQPVANRYTDYAIPAHLPEVIREKEKDLSGQLV
jgi:hypothetical protein